MVSQHFLISRPPSTLIQTATIYPSTRHLLFPPKGRALRSLFHFLFLPIYFLVFLFFSFHGLFSLPPVTCAFVMDPCIHALPHVPPLFFSVTVHTYFLVNFPFILRVGSCAEMAALVCDWSHVEQFAFISSW